MGLALQEFDFEIRDQKERENVVDDCLSRLENIDIEDQELIQKKFPYEMIMA